MNDLVTDDGTGKAPLAEEEVAAKPEGVFPRLLAGGPEGVDIGQVLATRAARAVIEAKRVPQPPSPQQVTAEEDEIIAAAAAILAKRKQAG